MKKMSPTPFVPCFTFDRASGPSLYQQVYNGFRAAILDGRLRPGQRLLSTRALARELGISRLPVLTAFEQLLHEGYIVGRVGAGTFVSSSIVDRSGLSFGGRGASRRECSERSPVGHPSQAANAPHAESLLAPFRVSLPALDRFPSKTWARLVS